MGGQSQHGANCAGDCIRVEGGTQEFVMRGAVSVLAFYYHANMRLED